MSEWEPEDEAPEGVALIVSGGIAMKKNGTWYTGMEEPLYKRPIQWEVTGWMAIPVMQHEDVRGDTK